ncbi:MAG: hypothetical protein U9Q06_01285 [Nanoarchaeota archaeon]|nr:hypothetical protein [Nanoarchaeota archaeon]
MEGRPVKSKRRYVLAFVIGTAIFILIFFLSSWISLIQFQRISGLQERLAYDIFEDKLSYSFFELNQCSDETFEKISKDLGYQGRIIDDLEKKFGKDDPKVLFRKKFYTLVLVEHFEFMREFNEMCNVEVNTIFFFYSNSQEDLGSSEDLGRLLGIVYNRNPNLVIYSFDIDLDSEIINNLKQKYDVEEPLTLIVNEEAKIVDLRDISEIEEYLN